MEGKPNADYANDEAGRTQFPRATTYPCARIYTAAAAATAAAVHLHFAMSTAAAVGTESRKRDIFCRFFLFFFAEEVFFFFFFFFFVLKLEFFLRDEGEINIGAGQHF